VPHRARNGAEASHSRPGVMATENKEAEGHRGRGTTATEKREAREIEAGRGGAGAARQRPAFCAVLRSAKVQSRVKRHEGPCCSSLQPGVAVLRRSVNGEGGQAMGAELRGAWRRF